MLSMGDDLMGVMRINDGVGRFDVDGPAWGLPPLVSASPKRDPLLRLLRSPGSLVGCEVTSQLPGF